LTISTHGDLAGSIDPLDVASRNLIGQAVWRIPVVGYLIEILLAAFARTGDSLREGVLARPRRAAGTSTTAP
jgi:hypothetical protein